QVLAFGPWVDALRSGHVVAEVEVFGGLAPLWRAELARLLPQLHVEGEPAGHSPDHLLLFEAATELIRGLAAKEPVLVMLEDAPASRARPPGRGRPSGTPERPRPAPRIGGRRRRPRVRVRAPPAGGRARRTARRRGSGGAGAPARAAGLRRAARLHPRVDSRDRVQRARPSAAETAARPGGEGPRGSPRRRSRAALRGAGRALPRGRGVGEGAGLPPPGRG